MLAIISNVGQDSFAGMPVIDDILPCKKAPEHTCVAAAATCKSATCNSAWLTRACQQRLLGFVPCLDNL